ncbi:MAG: AAA family ATPase, partial [Pseudomonadota bacterium]|nr:AAA family ATPase [Pseudomonadota bacterium]
MTDISRVKLFGKLNKLGYQAVEGATTFAKLRNNSTVEMVHWFHQILNGQDSDLHRIIQHYDLDVSRVATDMTAALDTLPRGASSGLNLSEELDLAMERAWVQCSLRYGQTKVRTGHIFLAMLENKTLRASLFDMSEEFRKIKLDDLAEALPDIVAASPEQGLADSGASGGGAEPGEASGARKAELGGTEALDQFCTDLTAQARNGEIDPIVGRDEEIRQIVDVLMRRRQNNPILTGEAGVGKTAVVEGFALRIARGDVPPALKDVRLLVLDVGLLQAGASMKGEFENRLRQVIDEVQASPTPIVMFVDETHTLVGAGGAAGTGDAANLLKPALARGTLRTIGATTWAEYKKYIE